MSSVQARPEAQQVQHFPARSSARQSHSPDFHRVLFAIVKRLCVPKCAEPLASACIPPFVSGDTEPFHPDDVAVNIQKEPRLYREEYYTLHVSNLFATATISTRVWNLKTSNYGRFRKKFHQQRQPTDWCILRTLCDGRFRSRRFLPGPQEAPRLRR